jgi:hypothetical protein
MATKELFDKKFVIAAIIVGAIYALIVVVVDTVIGKEAAGVAGVALTALATALFSKFETLQFRRISDEESNWVYVPPINIWRVAMFMFAFLGANHFLALAVAFLPETWLGDTQVILFALGITLFVYFILSFVGAKAIVRLRYSTVAVAVVLTQTTSILYAFLVLRSAVVEVTKDGMGLALGAHGVACLVFVVVALLGVRFGLPSRRADNVACGPALVQD